MFLSGASVLLAACAYVVGGACCWCCGCCERSVMIVGSVRVVSSVLVGSAYVSRVCLCFRDRDFLSLFVKILL